MPADTLTVLRCAPSLVLTKTFRADGSVLPYSSAKNFTVERRAVGGIEDLWRLIAALENDPQACLIRGTPKRGLDLPARRLLENFEDLPLHTVLIEVDDFQPLLSDPLTEPLEAIDEYVRENLPSVFHDASYVWQHSSSAGREGKRHLLKVHLWYQLETAYDSVTLRAWANAIKLQADKSVLNPVQIHFCSAPILEDGVADPLAGALRSGLWRGARDTVPLDIDASTLAIRDLKARQRGERLEVDDPLADFLQEKWEIWDELPNGGLKILCPFDAHHSSGTPGDSSTCYFPAGTNAYAEGRFVCLHVGCSSRSQEEFRRECGWSDQRMACLAVDTDPDDSLYLDTPPTLQVNGRVPVDPLVLPPFKRDTKGEIETTLENVVAAVGSERGCGADVVWDTFRGELMLREAGDAGWRSFADADGVELRIRLGRLGFKKEVSKDLMRDALTKVGTQKRFDSAQEWLNCVVPAWDGVARLERFWPDHMNTEDSEYTQALGLYSWTAQAARVLDPGCQVDMIPVLVSPEGYRKTSAIKALAPAPEFYASFRLEAKDEDLSRLMRGCLVGELEELRGVSAREGEAVKAWITKTHEKWTPKFLEYAATLPRRLVFYGTSNDESFLQPHMGERRWNPVTILSPIDVDRIVTDRLQLWAEARERYLAEGVVWQSVERLARNERDAFRAEDTWRDAVECWLERPDLAGDRPRDKPCLRLAEVADGALAIPPRAFKRPDQLRLAKVLRGLGFKDVLRRIDGKPTKVWALVASND